MMMIKFVANLIWYRIYIVGARAKGTRNMRCKHIHTHTFKAAVRHCG